MGFMCNRLACSHSHVQTMDIQRVPQKIRGQRPAFDVCDSWMRFSIMCLRGLRKREFFNSVSHSNGLFLDDKTGRNGVTASRYNIPTRFWKLILLGASPRGREYNP